MIPQIATIAVILFFHVGLVAGQEDTPAAPTAAPLEATDAAPPSTPRRPEILDNLLQSIQRGEAQVAEIRKRESTASASEMQEIADLRREAEADLAGLRRDFESVATGIEIQDFEREVSPTLDWSAEVKDLLGPMINELKRVTTRPRELDRLSREIEDYREKLALTEKAIENLDKLEPQSSTLQGRLEKARDHWDEQRNRLTTELQLSRERLERLQGERTSLYETVQHLTQIFFRSRGRNLLLAMLAFAAAWAMVRGLHLFIKRVSPMHRGTRNIAARFLDLLFVLSGSLVGILAAIGVLYTVGDWVLLTVVSLFLFGIAWASRAALPRIWRQAMILMNLGGVREGERLIVDGVPFRVDRLGFYTDVRNPALEGGLLRLPLSHLADRHTRPFGADERWFPSNQGDWVLLADGTHGKIVHQSPELVTLICLGGARKLIPTADFIQQTPTILAAGFRLTVVFGVDYQHQAKVTDEIPAKLYSWVEKGLVAAGHKKLLRNLNVEFKEAGASSLDIAVLADFDEDAAPKYNELQRLLQRLSVEACNEYGWVIPFSQLTLHMAATKGAS